MKTAHRIFKPSSVVLCVMIACWGLAQSPAKYTDLHDFGRVIVNSDGSVLEDGGGDLSGVRFDRFGNLYGTTSRGGEAGAGMVWQITRTGAYKDLHDFQNQPIVHADGSTGDDGSTPAGPVTVDAAGNLYGTATAGGAYKGSVVGENGGGIVWEIDTSGQYHDLHDFGTLLWDAEGNPFTDGQYPVALSSNNAIVHVPAAVFVEAGGTKAVFSATTKATATDCGCIAVSGTFANFETQGLAT